MDSWASERGSGCVVGNNSTWDNFRFARPESEPSRGERYGLLTTASIRQYFFSGPFMFEWRKLGRFMAG